MENDAQKNSFAIAGLVLGVVSVLFSFIYGWIGLIAGIVGIVLSVKARKIPSKNGMATAGLVLSIIGTSLSGVLVACTLCVIGTVGTAIANL